MLSTLPSSGMSPSNRFARRSSEQSAPVRKHVGHVKGRMLELYSHIRIGAKRQALDALDAPPQ